MKNRSIHCTNICSNLKRTETECNPQPATTIRKQLFLNLVYNQAGFSKSIIKGRDFVYLGISKMIFTLGKLEMIIFDYKRNILGSWKSDNKKLWI